MTKGCVFCPKMSELNRLNTGQRHRWRRLRIFLALVIISTSLASASGAYCELRPILDQDYYPTLMELVAGAQKRIGIMHFLLFSERGKTKGLVNELIKASKRGVDVRLLLEGHKSGVSQRNRLTANRLEKAGIKVAYSGRSRLLHTKMVLVDNSLVLVGSSNLTNTSLSKNYESNVLLRSRVASKALWSHFDVVFAKPWVDHSKEVVIEDGTTSILTDSAFVDEAVRTIDGAKKRVRVMSYLFAVKPDCPWSSVQKLVGALVRATRRGVHVEILLEKSDHSYFVNQQAKKSSKYLRSRGIVSIRFDAPNKITHSKLIIADDDRVIVGSTNWFQRGLTATHQVNVATSCPRAISTFTDYFDELYSVAQL